MLKCWGNLEDLIKMLRDARSKEFSISDSDSITLASIQIGAVLFVEHRRVVEMAYGSDS